MVAAATTGLLGSLHCAGMCGPLALAIGTGSDHPLGRLLLFVTGKAGTYAILGTIAGLLGAAFGAASSKTVLGESGLAWVALVAGTLMIGLGVQNLWRRLAPRPGSRPSAISLLLGKVLRTRSPWSPVVAGALTGLLPCGLTWAMTAQALAAGSALSGALVMAAFGAGTAPAMVVSGWLGSRLSGTSRRQGEILAASAVIAMGAVAIWRGVMILSADPAAAASCCH
ncbi:MAG: sulfite exporter TauE/SafE family protein [Deltaproteobacteria bacterium]|nr:sulfite exporter TauE/SafE family protein [Deltaproteobacteria bacterium]